MLNPKCWQCGGKTKRPWEIIAYYVCDACDCTLICDRESPSKAFTDEAYMKEWDYIDHATVHVPSPA